MQRCGVKQADRCAAWLVYASLLKVNVSVFRLQPSAQKRGARLVWMRIKKIGWPERFKGEMAVVCARDGADLAVANSAPVQAALFTNIPID